MGDHHRCAGVGGDHREILLSHRCSHLGFYNTFLLARLWDDIDNSHCVVSAALLQIDITKATAAMDGTVASSFESFALFCLPAEPHSSEQIIPDEELMVERRADMQQDQQEQDNPDQTMQIAQNEQGIPAPKSTARAETLAVARWWKLSLGRTLALAELICVWSGQAEGPDKAVALQGKNQSGDGHANCKNIQSPVSQFSNFIQEAIARGGPIWILGAPAHNQANQQHEQYGDSKDHVQAKIRETWDQRGASASAFSSIATPDKKSGKDQNKSEPMQDNQSGMITLWPGYSGRYG